MVRFNSRRSLRIVSITAFEPRTRLELPLYDSRVAAGFPSPAEDFCDQKLDLNDFLVKHPAATFFVRVAGDSMTGAGIHSGDILIVDRSLSPQDGQIVIALIRGEFTVKRIRFQKNKLLLVPENDQFEVMEIKPDDDFQVWGVVIHVIHSF